MATWATSFWPPSAVLRARSDQPSASTAAAANADLRALTGIPNDDIYLYCKRIDNSRTVRQAETRATGEWSAIAGACTAAVMVAGMLIYPGVQSIRDSYKVQDLKREQAQLRNDLRKLDVQEELMISAARLDTAAPDHHLARPAASQVIRLQPKNNHSFAMNGFKKR